MNGPGKYGDLCAYVREHAGAQAAIVMVIDGKHGDGFSVQTTDPVLVLRLPAILEETARQIRALHGGTT